MKTRFRLLYNVQKRKFSIKDFLNKYGKLHFLCNVKKSKPLSL